MLKLMIVDDEFFVRKGIIESINWSEYEIEICGEASDGAEALRLLPNLQPDCVLTDIKMGEIDGLKFIEEARKINENIVFVILSGYDDFEYARKAISLGVSEYLLKPIGAEELIKVVLQIKEKFIKNQELNSSRNSSLQNSVMLSWNTPHTVLSIDTSYFRVFTFSVDNIDTFSNIAAFSGEKSSLQDIPGIIQEYFNMAGINHIVKMSDTNLFVVMLNYKTPFPNFTEFLNCFMDFLFSKTGMRLLIGCGQEYLGYSNINQSYNEAFGALAFHYHKECPAIVYSTEIPEYLLKDYMYNPALQNFKAEIKYFSDVAQIPPEQYVSKLDLLFRKIEKQELLPKDIETLFLKIFIINLNRLNVSVHVITQNIKLTSLVNFDNYNTLPKMYQKMQELPDIIQKFQISESYSNYQNIIDIVIKYVHAHYSENISLNLLSQQVHVTPNYLSKIFKETVGENFKEWLTRYRISKSQELLMDTSLKTYEIAKMVGFSEYKHFAAVFKKYVGCSAKEYRMARLK